MNKILSIAIAALFFMLSSCNSDYRYESKLNHIKEVGDTDPLLAMRMLDSIKMNVRGSSEYIQKKYDLLEIRLKDKACVAATSDLNIKPIVAYFNEYGTEADRCEAYYYAGSVYRDLHDTPRSLEFFFRAQDLAERERQCDSVMLRNIYSNLHYLFWGVQDYANALTMARKEYAISEGLNDLWTNDAIHIGATLIQLGRKKEAEKYFVKAFKLKGDDESDIALLSQFANLGRIDLARACYERVRHLPASPSVCLSLGDFFRCVGEKDSALHYYGKVLDSNGPLETKYDAAHGIFDLDKNINNATSLIKISDSLDLGERQQRAATINNQHQYHRDMNMEQEMKQKNKDYRFMLTIVTFCFILAVVLGVLAYIYKKYKFSKMLIQQDERLGRLNECIEQQREMERSTKDRLEKAQKDYSRSQEELENVNNQLAEMRKELDTKKTELEERIKQTSDVMRLLHRSELTTTAEDIATSIKEASEGKHDMEPTDWLQLYQTVDCLYPSFGEALVRKFKRLSEQQKQVCYLLRIGLTNIQIENITNLSHVTVWRWVRKYGEAIGK